MNWETVYSGWKNNQSHGSRGKAEFLYVREDSQIANVQDYALLAELVQNIRFSATALELIIPCVPTYRCDAGFSTVVSSAKAKAREGELDLGDAFRCSPAVTKLCSSKTVKHSSINCHTEKISGKCYLKSFYFLNNEPNKLFFKFA
jgi:hypothetical protein